MDIAPHKPIKNGSAGHIGEGLPGLQQRLFKTEGYAKRFPSLVFLLLFIFVAVDPAPQIQILSADINFPSAVNGD
ncbi:MAG: hypothetical protein CMM10_14835 [Rhodospirillaceae bacterium]|nr:hypothetical protein [Rhodospirillaceae bacterium]